MMTTTNKQTGEYLLTEWFVDTFLKDNKTMLRPYQTIEELPFKKGDVITLRAIETKYADSYEVKGFEMKNELYVCVTGGKLRESFLCENFEILINGNWCPMGVKVES